jgi:hypothetical protein
MLGSLFSAQNGTQSWHWDKEPLWRWLANSVLYIQGRNVVLPKTQMISLLRYSFSLSAFTFFTALYCTLLNHNALFEQNLGRWTLVFLWVPLPWQCTGELQTWRIRLLHHWHFTHSFIHIYFFTALYSVYCTILHFSKNARKHKLLVFVSASTLVM